MDDKNCVFCKIARKEIKSDIVAESDSFIAIKDANPIVKGHTLVIPKKHCVTLLDLPDKLGQELLSFTKKIAGKMLDDKLGDGFNILMNNLEIAGQVFPHAHIHVIPRKESDGLRMIG